MTDTIKTVQALVEALEDIIIQVKYYEQGTSAIVAGKALIEQMQRDAVQPVADVTADGVVMRVDYDRLPVGTKLYAAPQPAQASDRVEQIQPVHSVAGASSEPPTTPAPEGWRWILVDGSFAALVLALMRADGKGYMPDAMADEWEAFNWQEAHEVKP